MTHKEMHTLMDKILNEVASIRDEGQKEYAHDDNDVFANFNRVGNLLKIDKKKVLMTYALKHVDGIAAFVKGHKSQREDVTGRITDCIVYLMLLWGMIEEEEQDGLRLGEKDNQTLRMLRDTIKPTDSSLSMEGGRVPSSGYKANGDMRKMRKEGSGLKELEEMGTSK